MKKLTIVFAVIGLISALFATTMIVHTTTGEQEFEISEITSITFDGGAVSYLLTDDFESYDISTFPSAGGWTIGWNGAGNQYQYITDQYCNTEIRSFRLQGTQSWAAQMLNQLSQMPDVIYFEACFYSESENDEGSFGLKNPNVGTWGTGKANVQFYNGMITCAGDSIAHNLATYIPQQWYKVKVKCDFLNDKISAWVNDELILLNEDVTYNTIDYTDFYLHAWNDGTNIVFFDDVRVWTE